jgi:AcrR family transcriptional regulator
MREQTIIYQSVGGLMARPRSEEKRNAILDAAMELIAQQGPGAATAEIAKKARVPHGSVFTYFATKPELLNALYLQLKIDLSDFVLKEMPAEKDTRDQLNHLWVRWITWGVSHPSKRRVLAQLGVSDLITDVSRRTAGEVAERAVEVVHQASAGGALKEAPVAYVGALVETMVGATIDFVIREGDPSLLVSKSGFDALWNALT